MFFQCVAVIVLIMFYGCYFGKMLLQKRQGIQTDQLGKGKTGFVKTVECTVKAASILVPVAEVISIVLNTSALPDFVRFAGAAAALAGVAVFVWSVITMRDNWRAGVSATEKTELVTSGVYQYSRNPAFLGFDLVYLGIAMMFFNWILALLSAFAILMFHLQIVNVEEDFLLETFGQEYLLYRQKVNRYLGRKK